MFAIFLGCRERHYLLIIGTNAENKERLSFFNPLQQLAKRCLWIMSSESGVIEGYFLKIK